MLFYIQNKNNMAIFDSLGNFVLYSTESTASTRNWTRDTSAGDKRIFPEKLKYYVLKNPPSTVKGAPLRRCSGSKTVVVNGKTYAVDPSIYSYVVQSLEQSPVFTLQQLQERIKMIRVETNNPSPLSVQLKDVPLRGLIKNYQYESVGDKWKDVKTSVSLKVSVDFIAGNPVDLVLKNFPLLVQFQSLFTSPRLMVENATYILVQQNNGCSYTGKVADLYGSASRVGSTILAIQSKQDFTDYGIFEFAPILCFMVPYTTTYRNGNMKAKFGFLVGFPPSFLELYELGPDSLVYQAIAANSELLFIPIQSDLEIIENIDVPKGNGVSFPVTNGGDFNVDISSYVQQYNNASKGVLASQAQVAALKATQAAAQAAAAQAAVQIAIAEAAQAALVASSAATIAASAAFIASSSQGLAVSKQSEAATKMLLVNSNYSSLLTFSTKATAIGAYIGVLTNSSLVSAAAQQALQASNQASIQSSLAKSSADLAASVTRTASLLLTQYPIVQPSVTLASSQAALAQQSYVQTLTAKSISQAAATQAGITQASAVQIVDFAQAYFAALPP
jgi:hypothetical protein